MIIDGRHVDEEGKYSLKVGIKYSLCKVKSLVLLFQSEY